MTRRLALAATCRMSMGCVPSLFVQFDSLSMAAGKLDGLTPREELKSKTLSILTSNQMETISL